MVALQYCVGFCHISTWISHWYMYVSLLLNLPFISLCHPIPLSSVQFSHSVVSDSLRPHESQHARPPCPSPTPRVYSNSCSSSQWYHPAISSSVVPFCTLLLPPIPPSIRDFSNESALHIRWPKYWSFSFSIIPTKEIPGLISLQSKGPSSVFSNTTVQTHRDMQFQ